MNFFTKIRELLRQKEQIARKPQKHDANLQKNSTLYFQVGLIICLLTTNALFEMYFETTIPEPIVYEDNLTTEMYTVVPQIEKKPILIAKAEPKPIVKRRLVKPPIVVPDITDVPKEESSSTPDEPVINNPVLPETTKVVEPKVYSTISVEEVPIYPGCEKLNGNKERVKCMSDKLAKIVQRKFNGDLAANHGLEGVQKIFVQFTIDKTGNVTSVKTRAPHPSLDNEAKRVMTKVPKMQPGKQSDIPVDVMYSLPIIFKVEN